MMLIGSKQFVLGNNHANSDNESAVYISIEGKVLGRFTFRNHYRDQVPQLLKKLNKKYPVAILSGDNAGEKEYLQELLGFNAQVLFHQKPEDKLESIKLLQQKGKKVMMVGDGLNDAGALRQAEVGIAITDNSNAFTPASDVIMKANELPALLRFIKLCKDNKKIVMAAFIVSIIYNTIGIYFSVRGELAPMSAAILMPSSTLSIFLVTFGVSNLSAWKMRMK